MVLFFCPRRPVVVTWGTLPSVTGYPHLSCDCLQSWSSLHPIVLLPSRTLWVSLNLHMGRTSALFMVNGLKTLFVWLCYLNIHFPTFLYKQNIFLATAFSSCYIITTYLVPEKPLTPLVFFFPSQETEFSFKIIICFSCISVMNSNPEN